MEFIKIIWLTDAAPRVISNIGGEENGRSHFNNVCISVFRSHGRERNRAGDNAFSVNKGCPGHTKKNLVVS